MVEEKSSFKGRQMAKEMDGERDMHIHIYIYIYREREKDREKERERKQYCDRDLQEKYLLRREKEGGKR